MGWLHAGLHPQRAESFCNLKLPHLAQSLHLGEVFLLERKSYESLSFPIVSNPMSSPFPAIRRLVLISRQVFTNVLASLCRKTDPETYCWLANSIVNDKGRYRQLRDSSVPKLFRGCGLRPRFQVGRSLHLEASVCFRYTAPLFAQKRGQAETESVPTHLHIRGTG
jgi:hypothetical protein